MTKTISFNRHCYDPYIDFIKGISIIFVILNHCIGESLHYKSLYCLWGDSAVPIFLIIQTFHVYKRGLNVRFSISKVWKRVLKNFILMQLVLIAIFAAKHDGGIVHTLGRWLSQGGFGSGSYYVWVYFQFAILLPLCAMIFQKIQGWYLFLFFVVVCELSEILFSVTNVSNSLYRLICLRYLFLIYLGFYITQKGISMKKEHIIFSILSLVAVLFFYYSGFNLKPVFYTDVSYSWRIFHWVSYFYIAYFFIFVLYFVYKSLKLRYQLFFCYLGKYSYEIFLFQMFYYAIAQYGSIPYLNELNNNISRIIYIILSSTICIATVPLYKHIRKSVNTN